MKTLLIAATLAATSLTTFARDNYYPVMPADTSAAKSRAEVIAEYQAAKAAGQIYLTEFEIRQADRLNLQQSTSSKSRQQVRQEVVAMRDHGQIAVHGDR